MGTSSGVAPSAEVEMSRSANLTWVDWVTCNVFRGFISSSRNIILLCDTNYDTIVFSR
jgi:hypothetical protein